MNRYPDAAATELKSRLRSALDIPHDMSLVLGNGSDEIIQMLMLAVARPGAVVLGVGLNVTTTQDELPPDRPATSLRLAGATTTDRDTLLRIRAYESANLARSPVMEAVDDLLD